VAKAEPDMNLHTLTVTWDDSKTTLDKIKKALAAAGFAVTEPAPGQPLNLDIKVQ